MEHDRKSSRGDAERYDLEILLRRPSLRTTLPRRVSQVRRDEIPTAETNCGVGCIRGRWLQSFANRSSFSVVNGILGGFYGSYYAYFYGVISTLEKRFKISSQTVGTIAAASDIVQLIGCFILSRRVPEVHRPKWIGVGVLLIVASTAIFTLPHFLHEPHQPKTIRIPRHSTYFQKKTDYNDCSEETQTWTENPGSNSPVILLILAQCLHGLGGGLYFVEGKSYEGDNIDKNKPPALLSLLSVLKILGPAFGYWLSSVCLKIFEHPAMTPDVGEDEPHWTGAWWLGSPIIGFVLIVPGFLISFFPTTLPKAAVRRIHNKLKGASDVRSEVVEKKGKMKTLKSLFGNPTIMSTHFSAIFNILGFVAYFIFLPKYVETQFRVSPSNANLIAGSGTLISSAVGIVTANSVITRYRPSARALAGWTVVVGVLSIGSIVSYIFLDCQANDDDIMAMVVQNLDGTCKCTNSSFFPVCDEYNQPFLSLCHAGCGNIPAINGAQEYEWCSNRDLQTRKVFKGSCPVDCYSSFLIFIIIICSTTFTYATGRTSNFWFEAKFEENKKKSLNLGTILSLLLSIFSPVVFGYLLDEACLVWEGNCWLYDNKKLRLNMNLAAVGFAVTGTIFDIGTLYLVKDLQLFDDIDYYAEGSEEN